MTALTLILAVACLVMAHRLRLAEERLEMVWKVTASRVMWVSPPDRRVAVPMLGD